VRTIKQLERELWNLKTRGMGKELRIKELTKTLDTAHKVFASDIDGLGRTIKELKAEVEIQTNGARVHFEMFKEAKEQTDNVLALVKGLRADKEELVEAFLDLRSALIITDEFPITVNKIDKLLAKHEKEKADG